MSAVAGSRGMDRSYIMGAGVVSGMRMPPPASAMYVSILSSQTSIERAVSKSLVPAASSILDVYRSLSRNRQKSGASAAMRPSAMRAGSDVFCTMSTSAPRARNSSSILAIWLSYDPLRK